MANAKNDGLCRVLSSGRRIHTNHSSSTSEQRVLKSGRRLGGGDIEEESPLAIPHKKQRTLYSQIGTILRGHDTETDHHFPTIQSEIQVTERKERSNQPTKKLLLQAVSDANKSIKMKLNKTNGLVKVMKPDGTTECLTTKTLAKRLKAKEPTWIDPSSLVHRTESNVNVTPIGKMKIQVRNEFCSTINSDDRSKISPMEFEDDEEDEFIVVVNNEHEASEENTSYSNNIWMLQNYPYDDNDSNQPDSSNLNHEITTTGTTFKRKLSQDRMSDDCYGSEHEQYSPPMDNNDTSLGQTLTNGRKIKRCKFWPDCLNGDRCEFVHPTQRCTHFPNCAYGSACLFIHPPCRFGPGCVRSDCPYLHSSSTPASSPSTANNPTPSQSSPSGRVSNFVVCKFGVQCMRANCMFSHPRIPTPSARNFKWVNNKWHASDDLSLAPPSPSKDIVYKNPFLTEQSSSLTNHSNEL